MQPDGARLRIMLNALVALDLLEMRRQKYPPIYRSHIRYKKEPQIPGRYEQWKTIRELFESGNGDCEDLAAARVAELRLAGIRAIPWLMKKGPIWHVVVKYPTGEIEDPSRKLGM